MSTNDLSYLVKQHYLGIATDSEREALLLLIDQEDYREEFCAITTALLHSDQRLPDTGADWNWLVEKILLTDHTPVRTLPRVHFLRRWWAAACILLLLLGTGAYLWLDTTSNLAHIQPIPVEKDIAPGKDGAILTLADGSQIVLDSLGNGVIAAQTGARVLLNNGELAYTSTGEKANTISWNTMFTPRGRQFRIILPDGTRAWLNAASSIRYPTQFVGAERRVEVTGEVYLEVAKNPQQPFKVQLTDQTEVDVLGTHFNINAYADEPSVKTTLLEGSVKISKAHSSQILQPGQQAVVRQSIYINKAADIQQVMAWKNGIFNFEGATLEEFLRQLARWYDLEIVYSGQIPARTFQGKMGRDLQLSDILEVLAQFNIPYRLQGHKLIIQ